MAKFWHRPHRSHSSMRLNHARPGGARRTGMQRVAILSCAALLSGPALAGELGYGGGYYLTYDSNIDRVPAGERSAWGHAIFAGLAYEEHTVDLNANLVAQVEKRVYKDHDELSDTSLYLSGVGVWTLSPQFFLWTAESSARDGLVDITQSDAPANRTQVASLRTGPDVYLRLSSVDTTVLGGRIGTMHSDFTGTTDTLSAYARLQHRTSEQSTLSLNYETLDTTTRDQPTALPSSVRTDLYARFEAHPLPNSFALDVGRTAVSREGAEDLHARLVQVTAGRQFTPDSSLRLSYLRQYSDTYTDLLRAAASPSVPGDTAQLPGFDVLTTDFYYTKRGELVYANTGGDFVYSLRGSARHVDYQTLNLDFREGSGRVDALWRYSGFTQFYGMSRYAKREFQAFFQEDVDRETIAGVRFNVSPEVSLSLEGGRMSRDSTASAAAIVNSRVMFLIGYSTAPFYTARSRR